MDIELVEIRDFLAHRTPFDALSAATLDALPRKLSIRYLRRGSPFPPADSDDDYLYVVRSGAIELRDSDGGLHGKLGEGDVYLNACQPLDTPDDVSGVSSEDSLLYLLPCSEVQALRDASAAFDRHLSESLRERLRSALALQRERQRDLSAMTLQSADLIGREPVTASPDTSIRQAAQLMSERKVSSLMIVEDERLVGLVTDRDLRGRCVAAGVSTDSPIRDIMTTKLHSIAHDALVAEALLTMTRLQIHHLPVLRDNQPVGMLTVADLVRQQSTNSAYLATEIQNASSVAALQGISQRLPELQLQLATAGATAEHIGAAVSSLTDAITRQLITLAEAKLGPAPAPYVWAAGGSQARHEQTSHSDQDNALILSDEVRAQDTEYFAALAAFVCEGLNTCGFSFCPGNAMASNPEWRQPVRVWHSYFKKWIDKPEPKALMLSSIFFDLRAVHGNDALLDMVQQQMLARARDNGIFIAFMAANALSRRPPLGFFRDFVLIHNGEHDATLDLKHRGVVPIVDIARVLALSKGLAPVNTLARLQAALSAHVLSQEMADNLRDAFEFIGAVRIQHQARQIRAGRPADNYLPPQELSKLERHHLKDAFRVIKTMQDTLEQRYQSGRFA